MINFNPEDSKLDKDETFNSLKPKPSDQTHIPTDTEFNRSPLGQTSNLTDLDDSQLQGGKSIQSVSPLTQPSKQKIVLIDSSENTSYVSGNFSNYKSNNYFSDVMNLENVVRRAQEARLNKLVLLEKNLTGIYYNVSEIGMAIRRDIDENYRNVEIRQRPTFDELTTKAKSTVSGVSKPKDSEQYQGYLEPLCDHIGHSIALIELFSTDYKFLGNESDKILKNKIEKSFLKKVEKSRNLLK